MRILLAVLFTLTLTTVALAQPDRAAPAPVVYEFEPESVPGTREIPRGEVIQVRAAGQRHSLIRPRGQLVEQLRASIEAL